MTTKLTLSVKKETVEKAKRFSAKSGKSVSRMVEEYFESLKEPEEKGIVERMNELMAPHRDRINKKLGDMTYKEATAKWRHEDYMKQYGNAASKASKKKTAIKR